MGRMKDLWIRTHEALIDSYMEQFPYETEESAAMATAPLVHGCCQDLVAEYTEDLTERAKDVHYDYD